jgi:adenylosuccinate lyase
MSDVYTTPLGRRYASEEMLHLFSDDTKFRTWRRLWIALAESEQELGLPVTEEQLAEMRAHAEDINYEAAARYEAEMRHDVMAHIHAYGDQCPRARGIIHWGATSSFVGDNTDILQMKQGLQRIKVLLNATMQALADFAEQYQGLATLAYTHFQPAQPTTVGKRATLWLHDLLLDAQQLDFQLGELKLLGCKGTTGTGASFLELFHGDHAKVKELELKIAHKMGVDAVYPVAGQTYSRKVDFQVLAVLSGIAQSAQKFSNDIRLLSHLKEVDEPFADQQVGSSAMPYKRNPMRSERLSSLARYVMTDALNPALTAGSQWFERTLDDSANRRISIPEAFLSVDAILLLYINIVRGLTVYPRSIARHLAQELPFMATENILMYAVARGGDRQILHEAIRRHSILAGQRVKAEGLDNDLLERIAADPQFNLNRAEVEALCSVEQFTGRAQEQTGEFLSLVRDYLQANPVQPEVAADIKI